MAKVALTREENIDITIIEARRRAGVHTYIPLLQLQSDAFL